VERSIWAEGRLAMGLLLAAMAVIALGLLGALRWLLHRLVLRRLDALARDVRRIRDEHDPTLRVADQGGDELGLLGLAINEMLDSLRRLNRQLLVEQDKSEQLLLNVLPRPIAERLKQSNLTIADSFADVSVLFADLTDFTRYSAHVSPVELVNLLDDLFTRFDALAEQHGLEKIKTIGDSYLVVGGLPDPAPDHVFAIAAMALDMRAALAQFNEVHQTSFQLRIGIHCGPVVAGVIGRRKFIYDIWGDTVNTASRLESNGVADAIQISAQLAHRISTPFEVSLRGNIELKGKGAVEAWWLVGRRDVSVG
jgi:adenylate cyclase